MVGSVPAGLGSLTVLKQIYFAENSFNTTLEPVFCDVPTQHFDYLESDCKGPNPEVICTCCTVCCDPDGANCVAQAASPTLAPALANVPAADLDARFTFWVGQLEGQTSADFTDTDSAQYMAANWLARQDGLRIDFTLIPIEDILPRYALAVLYFATNGPEWTHQQNFLSGVPICEWHTQGGRGEFCNADGKLIEIDLREHNLSGQLPTEIGFLSDLLYLALAGNNLNGPIPTEIGACVDLLDLDMARNDLDGIFVTEIGLLTQLTNLNLSENGLTGPLTGLIQSFTLMEGFFLNDNQLTGKIHSHIGQMTNCRVIDLANNQFDQPIPTELGNMEALEDLNFSMNSLPGAFPTEIGQLQFLQDVNVGKETLCHRWTISAILFLSFRNFLTRLCFSSFLMLVDINVPLLIFLKNNEIFAANNPLLGTTIPTELGNTVALRTFNAASTNFSGNIPTELTGLTDLKILNFGKCNIHMTQKKQVIRIG